MVDLPVSVQDVEAAASRLSDHVLTTPVVPIEGTPLVAKCENLQTTGAFKLRGATNALLALRPAGVVTASSGNHGRALAFAGRRLGIPVTVVMTADASPFKRAAVEALGGRIVECEPGFAAREAASTEIARTEGLTLIPPYDFSLTIAGQGTVGLELIDQVDGLSTVVVPIGGGGLISGIATAVKARRPGVRVVGIEPQAGDDFVRSRAAGRRIVIPPPQTICDGARAETPGELTFPVVEALVDDLASVDDQAVVAGMRLLAGAGLFVEPTGALSVAGALELELGAGTLCVLSGRNIDPDDWAALITGR